MNPKDRLIFALDVPDKETARKYVQQLREEVGLFKVGLELFLAEGPTFLEYLSNEIEPKRIFLDLKLYDIPSTILRGIHTILQGLAMITVPSDQGPTGLKKIMDEVGMAFKVLAVTVLTSLTGEDLKALGYASEYVNNIEKLTLLRAEMAKNSGCHGVICSGLEVKSIKDKFSKNLTGGDFLVICPGIRPKLEVMSWDDQRRIVTPYEAIKNGADYIVVGRPIRDSNDPVGAARRVVAEIAAGLKERRGP